MQTTFFTKTAPWGQPIQQLPQATNVAEAMKLAGLDWQIVEKPIFDQEGNSLARFAKAHARGDTGKILGIVGKNTHPLQNADAFKFFEPFLESGEAAFETAGVIGGGKKIWVLAKINAPDARVIGDDMVAKFVLLSNSHDGSASVRVGFTPIRVYCTNTLAMAHKSTSSQLVRVRHTKEVTGNVLMLRDAMNLANSEFEATAEMYRAMAAKKINQADLRKYIKQVLTMPEKDGEASTRAKNVVNDIVRLFESGRGSDMVGVRGTIWGAYNSVTEHLSWAAGRSAESRLDSLWFGGNAIVNARAFNLAMQLAV